VTVHTVCVYTYVYNRETDLFAGSDPRFYSQGRNAPTCVLVLLLTSDKFVSTHQMFARTGSGLYRLNITARILHIC
jgi:hypothetical protein